MRETKQTPTSSFTFPIVSQSLDLKAFDGPLGTTALLHLLSFTQDHCNPWNYRQMPRLHSAPLDQVSLSFLLVLWTQRRGIVRVYCFRHLLSTWRECHWRVTKIERKPDPRNCEAHASSTPVSGSVSSEKQRCFSLGNRNTEITAVSCRFVNTYARKLAASCQVLLVEQGRPSKSLREKRFRCRQRKWPRELFDVKVPTFFKRKHSRHLQIYLSRQYENTSPKKTHLSIVLESSFIS